MAAVYEYINTEDYSITYIGMVRSDDALERRRKEHRRDTWFNNNCIMRYVDGLTAADADIIETILISEADQDKLYQTGKCGYGKSSFKSIDIAWKLWTPFEISDEALCHNVLECISINENARTPSPPGWLIMRCSEIFNEYMKYKTVLEDGKWATA